MNIKDITLRFLHAGKLFEAELSLEQFKELFLTPTKAAEKPITIQVTTPEQVETHPVLKNVLRVNVLSDGKCLVNSRQDLHNELKTGKYGVVMTEVNGSIVLTPGKGDKIFEAHRATASLNGADITKKTGLRYLFPAMEGIYVYDAVKIAGKWRVVLD